MNNCSGTKPHSPVSGSMDLYDDVFAESVHPSDEQVKLEHAFLQHQLAELSANYTSLEMCNADNLRKLEVYKKNFYNLWVTARKELESKAVEIESLGFELKKFFVVVCPRCGAERPSTEVMPPVPAYIKISKDNGENEVKLSFRDYVSLRKWTRSVGLVKDNNGLPVLPEELDALANKHNRKPMLIELIPKLAQNQPSTSDYDYPASDWRPKTPSISSLPTSPSCLASVTPEKSCPSNEAKEIVLPLPTEPRRYVIPKIKRLPEVPAIQSDKAQIPVLKRQKLCDNSVGNVGAGDSKSGSNYSRTVLTTREDKSHAINCRSPSRKNRCDRIDRKMDQDHRTVRSNRSPRNRRRSSSTERRELIMRSKADDISVRGKRAVCPGKLLESPSITCESKCRKGKGSSPRLDRLPARSRSGRDPPLKGQEKSGSELGRGQRGLSRRSPSPASRGRKRGRRTPSPFTDPARRRVRDNTPPAKDRNGRKRGPHTPPPPKEEERQRNLLSLFDAAKIERSGKRTRSRSRERTNDRLHTTEMASVLTAPENGVSKAGKLRSGKCTPSQIQTTHVDDMLVDIACQTKPKSNTSVTTEEPPKCNYTEMEVLDSAKSCDSDQQIELLLRQRTELLEKLQDYPSNADLPLSNSARDDGSHSKQDQPAPVANVHESLSLPQKSKVPQPFETDFRNAIAACTNSSKPTKEPDEYVDINSVTDLCNEDERNLYKNLPDVCKDSMHEKHKSVPVADNLNSFAGDCAANLPVTINQAAEEAADCVPDSNCNEQELPLRALEYTVGVGAVPDALLAEIPTPTVLDGQEPCGGSQLLTCLPATLPATFCANQGRSWTAVSDHFFQSKSTARSRDEEKTIVSQSVLRQSSVVQSQSAESIGAVFNEWLDDLNVSPSLLNCSVVQSCVPSSAVLKEAIGVTCRHNNNSNLLPLVEDKFLNMSFPEFSNLRCDNCTQSNDVLAAANVPAVAPTSFLDMTEPNTLQEELGLHTDPGPAQPILTCHDSKACGNSPSQPVEANGPTPNDARSCSVQSAPFAIEKRRLSEGIKVQICVCLDDLDESADLQETDASHTRGVNEVDVCGKSDSDASLSSDEECYQEGSFRIREFFQRNMADDTYEEVEKSQLPGATAHIVSSGKDICIPEVLNIHSEPAKPPSKNKVKNIVTGSSVKVSKTSKGNVISCEAVDKLHLLCDSVAVKRKNSWISLS